MIRLSAAALIALAAALPIHAETTVREDAEVDPGAPDRGPVVVELFTSQGCSSCPLADRILADLAEREDVLALALHVDYWDYIGWKDAFADPAYTMRQKAYAHAAGERMIYTPQMVIQGEARIIGTQPAALLEAMGDQVGRSGAVALDVARDGVTLRIEARAASPFDPPLIVQLVRYVPHRRVSITDGENAGHTLDYANVVTGWERVARWDGQAPLSLTLSVAGEDAAAVLVQEPGPASILAAARAD